MRFAVPVRTLRGCSGTGMSVMVMEGVAESPGEVVDFDLLSFQVGVVDRRSIELHILVSELIRPQEIHCGRISGT